VAAWRHIKNVFDADGVTNLVYVWNVVGSDAPFSYSFYPGDAYVDWIAWDPYNWYHCDGRRGPWGSWSDEVGPFYQALTQAGLTSKPWMLAEYGSDDDPASPARKGDWFRALPRQARADRPLIKAVVYFDREHGDCQWNIDSSRAATAGFVAAGHDSYFNQPHG
jgi:beta-mannanase